MKVLATAAILGAAILAAPFLRQEREKSGKDIVAVKATDIKWEKADGMPEGIMVSHLTGESSASPFVDMLKFPRGTRVPLHWHSANHILTVMSGTLVIGREGKPDESAGMEVGPGGYFRFTAKAPHWTFAKEDTVFVVSGDKESDIHWLDKEGQPRKK
jgi:quercetin dioxygenase-like cupin family protein